MKLLAKKHVNTLIQLERSQQVQEGVGLAKRVDALRETVAKEEQQLREYRAHAIAEVQKEIDTKLEELEQVRSEVKEATELRNTLLKPLNKEWQELNLEKSELVKEKERISVGKLQLAASEERHTQDLVKLAEASNVVCSETEELEKVNKRISRLKKLTEQEYELAVQERAAQNETNEKESASIALLKASYETGLVTLESERKQIEEREAEVVRERALLADRSAMLERDIARLTKQ